MGFFFFFYNEPSPRQVADEAAPGCRHAGTVQPSSKIPPMSRVVSIANTAAMSLLARYRSTAGSRSRCSDVSAFFPPQGCREAQPDAEEERPGFPPGFRWPRRLFQGADPEKPAAGALLPSASCHQDQRLAKRRQGAAPHIPLDSGFVRSEFHPLLYDSRISVGIPDCI